MKIGKHKSRVSNLKRKKRKSFHMLRLKTRYDNLPPQDK